MGLNHRINIVFFISILYLLIFQLDMNLYARKKASLWIHLKSCMDNQNRGKYDTITIYKNGLIYKKIPPTKPTSILLKHLDLGMYTIQFNSLYEKNIIDKITIDSAKEYTTTLCYDYINQTNDSTIEVLDFIQNSDKLTILFERSGCFTTNRDSFSILKNNNVYSITCRNYTKLLTASELDLFKCFELELQHLKVTGCTTWDTYIFQFSDYSIGFIDQSCRWYGYYNLLKTIFADKWGELKEVIFY